MITGALVLVLLAAGEAARLGAPDAPITRALRLMLLPAGVGFVLVLVVRVAELVAGRA